MVHAPFSYIKKTSSGFDLVNVPALHPNPLTVAHSDGDGAVNGVQIHVIKIRAGQGACTINIVPNNGQNLIAGFSFNRDSLKTWISSAGGTTQNVAVQVGLSAATITKVIDDPVTKDVYVWFGVGINGQVGSGTGSSNTYTVTYSGNFHDAEVLFITGNAPVGVPTGTFGNPALLNPQDSATYSSTNGDCISGAYYFVMSVSSYITRTITLTPDQGAPVGLVVSSNKSQLQAWINNGGSGPLSDSYASPYTGDGSSPLTVSIYPTNTQTLYAVYFDPNSIGANSCGVGHDIIISSQEDQGGQNSGTFASPITIDNNTSPVNALTVSRSQGECIHGAVYYSFAACANTNLHIDSNPMNGQYVGIGLSQNENSLAEFLLTGNYSLLDAHYEGYGNSGGSGGGGGSSCGSFANPSDTNNSNYTSFYGQYFINIGYGVWVLDTGTTYNNSNLPNACFTCGTWDNPSNTEYSNYYDAAGNYYVNQTSNVWLDPVNSVLITDINNLPDVVGSYTNGYFNNNADRANSDYYDIQGGWVYYTNYGSNQWMYNSYKVYGETNLPDYCAPGMGGGSNTSATHDLTYMTPNDGTYYVIIFDPNNIGTDSCGDSSQFKVSTEQLNCGGGGGGQDGTYPNPYDYGVNTYNNLNRLFKEGDCGEGKVWFRFSGFCRAPANLQVNSSYYGGGTVVYSDTKLAIYNWFLNGQTGDLGAHGGTTSLNTNLNIPVDGISELFVCVFHGGGNQCTNSTDTFNINMYAYSCGDFGTPGDPVQPAKHNDPIVLKNNDNRSTWRSAGECTYGTLFYQSLICTQPLTVYASDAGNVGIAWANDVNALYTWVSLHGAWSHSLSEFDGGSVAPTSTTNTATFTPTGQGTYYIAVYRENFANTCSATEFVNISTSQSNCNGTGNTVGTYASPLTIGNTDTTNVHVSTGDCFEGITYFSTVKCADNPLTITMTAGDAAHQQGIAWSSNLNVLKQMIEYYTIQGIETGWNDSYYSCGYNFHGSAQPVSTMPSHSNQETMYFATCDIGTGRGTPRCARGEQTTLVLSQSCPIIIVGGTSNLSGAANYSYDPFNTGLSGNGIALSVSDPASASLRSLMYSPTLAIDAHGEFPPIVCNNIEITMYANDISGATTHVITDNVTYTDIVVKNPSDPEAPVFIKPRTGHEFLISNANFYTGVIKVTFDTNIGNIVRTQVINQGGSFTNGRYQYSYITSKDTSSINLIVPSARSEVHHISPTSSISATKIGHNEFVYAVPFQIQAGSSIGLPFKYPNSSIQNNATVHIPANAANISGSNNVPPDYSGGVDDTIIFVPPTIQSDGPLYFLDGAYEPLNYDVTCDGACTCRFELPDAAIRNTTTLGAVSYSSHGYSCTCQGCPAGKFESAVSYGISLMAPAPAYNITISVPSLGVSIHEVCIRGESRFIPLSVHNTLSEARSVPVTITWSRLS